VQPIAANGNSDCPRSLFRYSFRMNDALRRVFAILVTFAFLSGTVETALSFPCHIKGGTHTIALHTGSQHHLADKERSPSKNPDTACFMCISGFSVLAPNPIDITIQTSSASFFVSLKTLSGRSVVIDPGIPKRIA
jgi:hypothetical protein